jgi:cell division protein FtsL
MAAAWPGVGAPPAEPVTPDGPRLFRPERAAAERRLLRRRRLVVAGAGGLAVLGLFAVVVVHVVLAQQQFQLANLSNRVSAEQAANESLTLQVDQLRAPSRVVSAAEQQLGMVSPPAVGYLVPGHSGAKVRAPAATAPTAPGVAASSGSSGSSGSPAQPAPSGGPGAVPGPGPTAATTHSPGTP